MPVKILFCYAHEDELLLNKLKTQLKPLHHQGLIEVWHDRDISAGTEWEQEIDKHLNSAHIILLLISPDFMNSEYCYSKEMKQAIKRHNNGEAHVIPIILRHVHWLRTPLSKLQALPADGKPIKSWQDLDEAFFHVVEGIIQVVEKLDTSVIDAIPVIPVIESQPEPSIWLQETNPIPINNIDTFSTAKTNNIDAFPGTKGSWEGSIRTDILLDDTTKVHLTTMLSDRQKQVNRIIDQIKRKTLGSDEVVSKLEEITKHQDDAEKTLQKCRDLANHYRSNHQIESALSIFNEMVRIAPLAPYAYGELAHIYIDYGLLNEGIEELGFLADIYLLNGQKRDAGKILLYIGNLYSWLGEREKAHLKLLRAVELAPDDMVLLREAVIIFLKLSSLSSFSQLCSPSPEREGHSSSFFWQEAVRCQALIAHHFFEKQDPKEAVHALHQLQLLDRYYFEGYDMLGQIYESVGEYEQACMIYPHRNLTGVSTSYLFKEHEVRLSHLVKEMGLGLRCTGPGPVTMWVIHTHTLTFLVALPNIVPSQLLGLHATKDPYFSGGVFVFSLSSNPDGLLPSFRLSW